MDYQLYTMNALDFTCRITAATLLTAFCKYMGRQTELTQGTPKRPTTIHSRRHDSESYRNQAVKFMDVH